MNSRIFMNIHVHGRVKPTPNRDVLHGVGVVDANNSNIICINIYSCLPIFMYIYGHTLTYIYIHMYMNIHKYFVHRYIDKFI